MDEYARAVPKGVSYIRVAANFAADLNDHVVSMKTGYTINMYVDAIDRCIVKNFGAPNSIESIGNNYVTRDSRSVLYSITISVRMLPTRVAHRYKVRSDMNGGSVEIALSGATGLIIFLKETTLSSLFRCDEKKSR